MPVRTFAIQYKCSGCGETFTGMLKYGGKTALLKYIKDNEPLLWKCVGDDDKKGCDKEGEMEVLKVAELKAIDVSGGKSIYITDIDPETYWKVQTLKGILQAEDWYAFLNGVVDRWNEHAEKIDELAEKCGEDKPEIPRIQVID